jgi:hypothetical protein
MRRQLLLRGFGAAIFLASALIFAWGVVPLKLISRTIPILWEELSPNPGGALADGAPVAWLKYEFPEGLRKGDAAKVRLTFEWIRPGDIKITTGDFTLISQLDLVGLPHTPTGEISQAFSSEHPVVFLWNLRAAKPGNYPGKIWLHSQPRLAVAGPGTRRLIAAQPLEIKVVSLLGFSGDQGRVFGAIGIVAGLLLSFNAIILRVSK